MIANAHERARQLIALAGPESDADRASSNAWLIAHLETCAPCRAFAENAAETVRELRAIPIAAERGLVSATQIRVRRRALELQRQRERMWLVLVSCAAVTLCTLLGTAALWLGFEWLGVRDSSVRQIAFLIFGLVPALVAAILLLAKDAHMAHHTSSYQG